MLHDFFHNHSERQYHHQNHQKQSQGKGMHRIKGLGNKIDPWKVATGFTTTTPTSTVEASMDLTQCLDDEVMLRILRFLPLSPYPYSQVCKRWMKLQGLLRSSIKVLDWRFLENERISYRFPNLTDIDLSFACLSAMSSNQNFSNILLTHSFLSIHLDAHEAFDIPSLERFIQNQQILPSTLDKGMKILADSFPDLQRLCVVDVRKPEIDASLFSYGLINDSSLSEGLASDDGRKEEKQDENDLKAMSAHRTEGIQFENSLESMVSDGEKAAQELANDVKVISDGKLEEKLTEIDLMKVVKLEESIFVHDSYDHGLTYIAQKCLTLQQLEIHHCTDESLNAISACKNLQIMRLVGYVSEYYRSSITDIGLTILARSCNRLVKLDLSGCEGSYDGIAAIGQCCMMLEELTVSNHMFYDGWIAGLSFCSCLKTLRLQNCKQIDRHPGPFEHLGYCMSLDCLQLTRCNLRDGAGFCALMMLSVNIRELEIEDCWGLDDNIFYFASTCRRLKLLSLEGCSPLTTVGLEMVVMGYKELQALRVVYCNNIKDIDISPELSLQFCNLKELKWRPDAKSLLHSSLEGTGIGQQGGKFFKKGGPN